MSYQTGTALHVDDLLSKLSVFAQANGWTQDKVVAGSGNGSSSELYLHKGASYVIYDAQLVGGNNTYHAVSQPLDHPFLYIYAATGHNGANAANNQPGTSPRVETNWLLPNMTAYHFFTDPAKTYLHVVVETTANEYRHIPFGLCDKLGTYEGGEYLFGHQWNQIASLVDDPANFQHFAAWTHSGSSGTNAHRFHCNVDGVRWKQFYFNTPFQSIFGSVGMSSVGSWLGSILDHNYTRVASPNHFNDAIILFKMYAGWIIRSTTVYTPMGCIEDVRFVNIKNVAPSSTYTLGGDDWLIFPLTEKKEPSVRDNLPNSGYYGFAYKKIP